MVLPVIEHTPEFQKCMHQLRKYNSIEEDLERFEKALKANFPDLKPYGLDVEIITGVTGSEYHQVFKARKFKCVYLKSTEMIRLIYTFNPYENKIIFIEIYCKNKQGNHNLELIKKYLVKIQQT